MKKIGRNFLPVSFSAAVCLLTDALAATETRKAVGKRMTTAFAGIIFCASLLAPPAFAATYTFSGSGNWTDAGRWSPEYPGTIIFSGEIVELNGDCVIPISVVVNMNGTLNINKVVLNVSGDVHNGSIINNNGTINIYEDGSIRNENIFFNNGTINVENLGGLYNAEAQFDNNGIVNINDGGDLVNQDFSMFINRDGGIVNINGATGSMFNTGLFDNENGGTLNVNEGGSIDQRSELYNNGGAFNISGVVNATTKCALTNRDNGTILIAGGGTLNLSDVCALTNDATLTVNQDSVGRLHDKAQLINEGQMEITAGGIMKIFTASVFNYSILDNKGEIRNESVLNNNGGIMNVNDNANIFNNATFNVNNSTVNINNSGALNNQSEMNIAGGSVNINDNNAQLLNYSTLNVNSDGNLNINGGDMRNQSALNIETGGAVNINNKGGIIYNNFILNVKGSLNINDGSVMLNNLTLNNKNGGAIYIYDGGELQNRSTLNNSTTGHLIIEGILLNLGSKDTEADVFNDGLADIGGIVYNYADLSNGKTGRMNIGDGGFLHNFSPQNIGGEPLNPTINNDGELNVDGGGFLENFSTLNNKIGAVLNNNDGGTLNNHGGGNLYNYFKLNNNSGAVLNNDGAMFSDNLSSFPAALNNSGTLNIGSKGSLTNYKVFNLDGGSVNNLGAFVVTETGALNRTANGGHVIGGLTRIFGSDTFTFHVGTANGYSPVTLSNVAGTGGFTVTANEGAFSGEVKGLPANRLLRWWQLDGKSITQADITFNYLQSDIAAGTEAGYRIFRIDGTTAILSATTLDATNNTATVEDVMQFSPWTLAELAPTAAGVTVAGRIMTVTGEGLTKAKVVLTDSSGSSRTAISSPFGYYRFDDVRVGETYILTVSSKSYQFTPLAVTINEAVENLNFTAEP